MLSSLLDLVPVRALVRTCAGCRGPGGPWCPDCAALLAAPVGRAVLRPHPAGLPQVRAVAAYDGAVREGLVAFKDHGRWGLARPLGRALARAVAAELDARRVLPSAVLLVPVPGSPDSARLRDGDHVRELARAAAWVLAREAGVAAQVRSVLVPARRRRDQVGLGRAARRDNLAHALVAMPLPAGTRTARPTGTGAGGPADALVVVVDDLVTTGATLAEAVRTLRAAGVATPAAAVVAARELGVVARST